MRKIFLDHLPVQQRKTTPLIDWKKSVGQTVGFVYDDIQGELIILSHIPKGSMLVIEYEGIEYKISTAYLKQCQLSTLLGRRKTGAKYSIGEVITTNNSSITIIERQDSCLQRNNPHTRKYKYHCIQCNNEDWISEVALSIGTGCNVCCTPPRKVKEGYNDIPTTAPWMVKYFQGGYEEAKLYTQGSETKKYFKCPHCQTVASKEYSISYLNTYQKLPCSCWGRVSFPERIVQKLLEYLDVNSVSQYTPHWSQKKRYDFYIPSLNIIIETHGMQHYKDTGWKTYEEEHENDLLKFDLSVINGIEHYVVLDCRKSELEWIKSSIMNSKLPELLGFKEEDIDWGYLFSSVDSPLIKEVCEEFKKNPKKTRKDLATQFGICVDTVRTYLQKGESYGWL